PIPVPLPLSYWPLSSQRTSLTGRACSVRATERPLRKRMFTPVLSHQSPGPTHLEGDVPFFLLCPCVVVLLRALEQVSGPPQSGARRFRLLSRDLHLGLAVVVVDEHVDFDHSPGHC